MSSLPVSARPHLERQLDWGHEDEDKDKDLSEISNHMPNWEKELYIQLGLTPIEIDNIKANDRDSLSQRWGYCGLCLADQLIVMQERGIDPVED